MPYFRIFPAISRACIMYIGRGLCPFDHNLYYNKKFMAHIYIDLKYSVLQ